MKASGQGPPHSTEKTICLIRVFNLESSKIKRKNLPFCTFISERLWRVHPRNLRSELSARSKHICSFASWVGVLSTVGSRVFESCSWTWFKTTPGAVQDLTVQRSIECECVCVSASATEGRATYRGVWVQMVQKIVKRSTKCVRKCFKKSWDVTWCVCVSVCARSFETL